MTEIPRRQFNKITKEKRILEAALVTFARLGYSAASMDAIATEAGVSKPTVYQYFPSKQALFTAMMASRRDDMVLAFAQDSSACMVAQLYDFACRYAETVLQPEFLSLARLIVAEAQRFPEIGQAYQASGPDRVLHSLMEFLHQLRETGRLEFDDAELAAQDLWGLILSAPRTKALYLPDKTPTTAEVSRYINNGLAVFLKAYSSDPKTDLDTLEHLLKRQ